MIWPKEATLVSRTQPSGPFCLKGNVSFLLIFSLFFLLLYPKLFQQSMGNCSHKKVLLLPGDPLRELMFEPSFKLKLNSSKLGFANWVYQDFNIAVKLCFWSWNGSMAPPLKCPTSPNFDAWTSFGSHQTFIPPCLLEIEKDYLKREI